MASPHALLHRVWDLEKAVLELSRSVHKRIRYVLTDEIPNSRSASQVASEVATAAHIRC